MKRISYLAYIIATCILSACGNEYTVEEIDGIMWTGKTPGTGTNNGHQWVDLGLSVNWATYNLGASSPEGYGDYYAWGETETKYTYNWSTYKYCNGSSSTMTKYCVNSSYGNNGFTDSKTTLEMSDDVARSKWGGSWRMPTMAEFTELINNCTWSKAYLNGVGGYKVSSKIPGYTDRFIFLPAAGYRNGTDLYNVGSDGYYWSSSLDTDYSLGAWYFYFYSSYVGAHYIGGRYSGHSVRPVCP